MISADEATALKEEIQAEAENLMNTYLKNTNEITMEDMRNNIEWFLNQTNHTIFKFLLGGQDER
jgi:hypothetical protein